MCIQNLPLYLADKISHVDIFKKAKKYTTMSRIIWMVG